MWYRSGAGARGALLCCGVLCVGVLGCGDAARQPAVEGTPPAEPEGTPGAQPASPAQSASDAAFRMFIDGWTEELGAKAQLNVTEGKRAVRLEITGTGFEDVLLLEVDFDGVEGSMGLHRVELGLPGEENDSAVASLDGQTYHSQSGHIEVTLAADGSISGGFELALAPDPEFEPGEPVVFELTDELRPLSGSFTGRWDLFCQSHLPGHSSLMKGGSFCEGVVFE